MEFQKGIISLQPLVELAEGDRTTGHYLAYKQDPGRAASLDSHIESLCSAVPRTPGLYLWGFPAESGGWQVLYVARAASRHRHTLHTKIAAELHDEKIIFWRKLYEERALIAFLRSIGRFRDDGKSCFRRCMIKFRATHIIWISTESLAEYDATRVESALIQRLRPEANIVRHEKPTPRSAAFTEMVLAMLQELDTTDANQ